jgi:general secretion pathway protein D
VPFLGRIPVLGEAFRTRSAKKNKTNLMVFIQPRILRDGLDATLETNQKYNYIRDEQRRLGPQREILPLLPGEPRAELPPLLQPAPDVAPAQTPAQTPAQPPAESPP